MGKTKKHILKVSGSTSKQAERKARAEAAKDRKRKGNVCNYDSQNEKKFSNLLLDMGLRIKTVEDQIFGNSDHMAVRCKIVEYMVRNEDYFTPFMEDDESFSDYIDRMRNDREWGGHQELYAAAQAFRVNIYVHESNGPRFVLNGERAVRNIHLSYHGEYHYNSIRKLTDNDTGPAEEIQLPGLSSGADEENNEKHNNKETRGKQEKLRKKNTITASKYDWIKAEEELNTIDDDVTEWSDHADKTSVFQTDNSIGDLEYSSTLAHQGTIMRPADSDSGEAAPSSEEYTAVASVADTSTKKKMCKIKNEDDDQKLFKGISKKDRRRILRELAQGSASKSSTSAEVQSAETNFPPSVIDGILEIHI